MTDIADRYSEILAGVADYYDNKLAKYGVTAQGVDWNGSESHKVRFIQLCKIIHPEASTFSINDLGCGYGALIDYLTERWQKFDYLGIDISSDMVAAAARRYEGSTRVQFLQGTVPDRIADYSVASGIFNVLPDGFDGDWFDYIGSCLDALNDCSKFGFAFNCLTSYSDEAKRRSDLYYGDPLVVFDLCKRRYSRQVALLHDYELFEFTILVRKN